MSTQTTNTHPTIQEMQQASDIVRRYGQANKAKYAREDEKFERKIQKDQALAVECEQVSNAIYKQIMDALPDERTKDLFASYSTLVSGKEILIYASSDTKGVYRLCDWTLKRLKKVLDKS